MTEEDDEFVRSFCFYKLNDMIDRYNEKTKNMTPAKRKLIMAKIENLARRSILTKDEVQKREAVYRDYKEKGGNPDVVRLVSKYTDEHINLE